MRVSSCVLEYLRIWPCPFSEPGPGSPDNQSAAIKYAVTKELKHCAASHMKQEKLTECVCVWVWGVISPTDVLTSPFSEEECRVSSRVEWRTAEAEWSLVKRVWLCISKRGVYAPPRETRSAAFIHGYCPNDEDWLRYARPILQKQVQNISFVICDHSHKLLRR